MTLGKLYLIFLVLCFPDICWGYIDPGSVTIFLQVILAFLVGGLLTVRNNIAGWFKSIVKFIVTGKGNNSDRSSDNDKE
jgi:hypothetical protein